MKKSAFLAVFGLAIGEASSYGQGYVDFSSYMANGGLGASTTIFENHLLVGIPFEAQLYYAFGTVSDPVNDSSVYGSDGIISPISSAFTLLNGVSAGYANSGASSGFPGYFDGGVAVIPGYTGGPITFEVVVVGSPFVFPVGRSGSFTMDSIANSASVLVPSFGDNGQPMPNFLISVGPEPTTLALAGLGGLVSLVMFRRKQA